MRQLRHQESTMEKKPDRRTLKTRKALRNGLAELLAEKELRKITVQEISDKADVNRVTFYKHCLDIYDLYDQLEKEILTELGLIMLKYQEKPSEGFDKELVDYIEQNVVIFRMIFSPHATGELKAKFSRMIEGLYRMLLTEKYNAKINDSRIDYFCTYHTQGVIAILEKWVLDNFTQQKTFIIETISMLDNHNATLFAEQFPA